MKITRFFITLAACSISLGAMASMVTPSATGTVANVEPRGSTTQVSIAGQSYTVTADTHPKGINQTLKPGQVVTLELAADGRTVLLIQPAAAAHPTNP
jgi:hypothetical protein